MLWTRRENDNRTSDSPSQNPKIMFSTYLSLPRFGWVLLVSFILVLPMQLGPQEILPGYELSPSQSELMALDITQQIAMVTRLHPKGVDFNIFGHIYKGPINQLYTFTRILYASSVWIMNTVKIIIYIPCLQVRCFFQILICFFPNIDLPPVKTAVMTSQTV